MRSLFRSAILFAAVATVWPLTAQAQSGFTFTPAPPATEEATHEPANSAIIGLGSFERRITLLPQGLLWRPPIANPEEPRSYMKLYQSLDTEEFPSVNDCAIGGTLPVVRFSRLETPNEGMQVDVFAVAFSRFVDIRTFAAVDYRFGVPFTYAIGKWSFKVAYEHTSCHVGDELLIKDDLPSKDSTRNETVFAISYRVVDALRVYGQFGWAWQQSSFVQDIDKYRYVIGAEWSKPGPTGVWGQPFAAIDCEFRGDEDYTPNVTAQIGWEWSGQKYNPGLRIALEYYDGRSPFGQFIDRHESWVALGVFLDL